MFMPGEPPLKSLAEVTSVSHHWSKAKSSSKVPSGAHQRTYRAPPVLLILVRGEGGGKNINDNIQIK